MKNKTKKYDNKELSVSLHTHVETLFSLTAEEHALAVQLI